MSKFWKSEKQAETRRLFVAKWPTVFAPKGADKRPLKIGVDADVRAALPDLPAERVLGALLDYRRGPTYLRNLKEGATRVGLDGNPAGVVTARQEKTSIEALRWFERADARRAAPRAAEAADETNPPAVGAST